MKDQANLLLGYLQTYKTITSAEAFSELGISRLSARIFDLREEGYDISLSMKSGRNRYGKTVSYGVYRLEATPDESGQLRLL